MAKTTYKTKLADAVAALIGNIGPRETTRRIRILTWAVGNANSLSPVAGLIPLREATQPTAGRFTDQQLVNLLKMPTCCQPARQVIVTQLGSQCGRPFANTWEFVDWAQEHRPDLDLTSPPVRPANPDLKP